ncbi:hypothetical protein KBZ10_17720 [Streptomyces sp. F63]|uniref:hypothetical protein n=1 Tax=Streptomyces sp. F63 TaxID=2824887 RepID=UPI001B369E48|nr:hypothetical protein [Streptomyces sp. F63]MBQ0986317.1 hypothetical protein [Streptomyces sp. F63]
MFKATIQRAGAVLMLSALLIGAAAGAGSADVRAIAAAGAGTVPASPSGIDWPAASLSGSAIDWP